MIKSLEDYYKEFVDMRSDEVCDFIFKTNDKYQELLKETINQMRKLSAQLSVGQKDLLYEYEEKKNEQIALMIGLIYNQGLKDGLQIDSKYKKIRANGK